MRFAVGLAVMMLWATVAVAQPANDLPPACAGFSTPPTAPDGRSARPSVMADAVARYEAWSRTTLDKQAQCAAEVRAVEARRQVLANAWQQAEDQRLAAAGAWRTQVERYNARGAERRARENAGGLTAPDRRN